MLPREYITAVQQRHVMIKVISWVTYVWMSVVTINDSGGRSVGTTASGVAASCHVDQNLCRFIEETFWGKTRTLIGTGKKTKRDGILIRDKQRWIGLGEVN